MMKKFLSRQGLVALAAMFSIGILFTACKKDDTNFVAPPAAGLMAFNLAPDQPQVAITISGNVISGSGLPFTSFTGRYINIYTGSRVLESYGSPSNLMLDSTRYTFEKDKYYSVFLVGANGNYQNVVTNDNYDSLTSSSDKAYVRYINAVPDSSAPRVTITSNGSNVANNVASFGQVSQFIAVTPGQVSVGVMNESNVNASRTLTVEKQKAYTLLVTGLPNQTDTTKAVKIRYIENGTVTD